MEEGKWCRRHDLLLLEKLSVVQDKSLDVAIDEVIHVNRGGPLYVAGSLVALCINE